MAITADVNLPRPSADVDLPRPAKVRRTSTAADAKKMRRIGARIFKELLPESTRAKTVASLRTPPSGARPERWLSGMEATSTDTTGQQRGTLALAEGKEASVMKAYRTTIRYYFSSKQLLPVGSVVFFSEQLQRYVHPVDGILLDGRPLLDPLSDEESVEQETRWHKDLARYA